MVQEAGESGGAVTKFWDIGPELKEFWISQDYPIVARRQFMLTSSYGITQVSSVLDGVTIDGRHKEIRAFWNKDPMTAVCFLEQEHTPPGLGCDCGFHAVKSGWRLINVNIKKGVGKVASGEIALWGRVVEHEGGYRGQFAKLLSIEEEEG